MVPSYTHREQSGPHSQCEGSSDSVPYKGSPATPCTMEAPCHFPKIFRLDSGYTQLLTFPGVMHSVISWLPVASGGHLLSWCFSPGLSSPGMKFFSQVHPGVSWGEIVDLDGDCIPLSPCSVEETHKFLCVRALLKQLCVPSSPEGDRSCHSTLATDG